jgi:hypothetical protein
VFNVSQAFLKAVVTSHKVKVNVAILGSDGAALTTPLYVTGGNVSVDGAAAIRRICDLTLVDPTGALIPQSGTGIGPLAPYGIEIKISRGVQFTDESIELAPLGVFRVSANSVKESDSASQTLSIHGYDRSRTIARNKLTVEYIIAADTNYVTAIIDLLTSGWIGPRALQVLATPTAAVTPLLILEVGADPWAKAQEMAAAIGYELYFNGNGAVVLQPVLSPAESAVVKYSEGPASVLLDLNASLDDEDGYNGVIITGESTSIAVPVRGEAWDSDPMSPTYYLGPYGRVPVFETSPYVVTQMAADAAARARLQVLLGRSQQVGFSIVPNPAHEPGDVITVTRLKSGVSADYQLMAFDVPLLPTDNMPLVLSNKRVLL